MDLLAAYGSSSDSESSSTSSSGSKGKSKCLSRKRPRPEGTAAGGGGRGGSVDLPMLDSDFFEVSADHVLTNGRRTRLPSSSSSSPASASHHHPHHKPSLSSAATAAGVKWIRAVPHIEGNWATHIYIRGTSMESEENVPNTDSMIDLAKLCIDRGTQRLTKGAHKLLVIGERGPSSSFSPSSSSSSTSNITISAPTTKEKVCAAAAGSKEKEGIEGGEVVLIVPNDLDPERAQHLSLSRTVYLRSHHIDPFVADLKKALTWTRSFAIGMGEEFGLLINDDKTRSFLTIEVDEGVDYLIKLVASVDQVLVRYRQPVFYKDPSFHISVASTLGDVSGAWVAGSTTTTTTATAATTITTTPITTAAAAAIDVNKRDKGNEKGKDSGERKEMEGREEKEKEENGKEEKGIELRTSVEVDMIECRIGKKLFQLPLRD